MPKTLLKAVSGAVVLGALLALPRYVESPYALHMMILLFLSVSQGQSWNILGGYAGQHSVGHAAYFGVGAYTTMMLMHTWQIAPWFGVWFGMALVVVVALAIGSICFRLRGPYFVLASIAVAEILRLSAINLTTLTNGAEGILATDLPAFRIGGRVVTEFLTKVPFYYIGLVLALLTLAITYWVQHSKLGYFLQAIREDQDAAHSLGISISRYKNIALVISAVLTSLAGSFYGIYVGFVDPPTVLGLDVSVQIMLICIIGGMGTLWGPVLGALVLVPLSEALRSNLITEALVQVGLVSAESRVGLFLKENLAHAHVLLYGILVVLVILFMPEGLMGFVRKLASRRKREA
ncbi:branched-chain amino acid ABC transporter permease [Geothrix limicola]|uniref:Branched-chain amino acid ABC transporter permease n=1 Tax=Geothrix limicola TaxID=2927978 RepID=A0ABQ5QF13_9BACT|nr:branched-chain amino acid ABC transporter permease [Geothrix limicola]GLH72629.1 branched-chain amino acid ABC transporter permease [Geothrix limicola]